MDSTSCKHPQIIGDKCQSCNKSKANCGEPRTRAFNYIQPNMCLSIAEIKRLRNDDLCSLINRKKLHLILDLDQTLVHATGIKNLNPKDRKSIGQNRDRSAEEDFVFKLRCAKYVVKLRPGIRTFIEQLSSLYDISIYTMGSRCYGHEMAKIIDPKGCIFKNIITREDCTIDNLKGLDVVLSHKRVTVIVDDTKEVWLAHNENLIHIEPYLFFNSDQVKEHCSGMDRELARVLGTLREVHTMFYDEKRDYKSKDVRKILVIVGDSFDSDYDCEE